MAMTWDEYKKKKTGQAATNKTENKTEPTSSARSWDEYKAQNTGNRVAGAAALLGYVGDFGNKISNDYTKRQGSYQDSFVASQQNAQSGLQAASYASEIDSYLDDYLKNKNAYEKQYGKDNYAQILKALQEGKTYLESVPSALESDSAYWGGFKNEDDYKEAVALQKKSEELAKADPVELQGNIDTQASYLADIDKQLDQKHLELAQVSESNPAMYKAKLDEIDSLNGVRNMYLNRRIQAQGDFDSAKIIQKAQAALAAPDFEQYKKMGGSMQNPEYTATTTEKDIQNKVIFGRENFKELDFIAVAPELRSTVTEYRKYHYMTEEEVSVYNYLLAKEGGASADEYLNGIEDVLNKRMGSQFAEKIDGSFVSQMLGGSASGLDEFGRNLEQIFHSEALPTSSIQYAAADIREDLEDVGPKLPKYLGGASLGQAAFDTVKTMSNMAPSILASYGTAGLTGSAKLGQLASSILFGASATGGYYKAVLDEGYTKEEARGYAALAGASEVVLQSILGGISAMGGVLTQRSVVNLISKIDKPLLRVGVELGLSMLGEGTEEYLQDVLDPTYRNLTLGERNTIDLLDPDALYSFMLGSITAGLMEGPSRISNTISTTRAGNAVLKANKYQELLNLALDLDLTTPENIMAYRIARDLETGLNEANVENVGELAKAYQKAAGNLDFMKVPNVIEQQASVETEPVNRAEDIESLQTMAAEMEAESRVKIAPESISSEPANLPTKAITKAETDVASPQNIVSGAEQEKSPVVAKLSDGKEVSIKGIAEVRGGDAYLDTSEGVQKRSEVSFDSEETDSLYKSAESFNDTRTAQEFIASYDGELSVPDYAMAYRRLYEAGRTGESFADVISKDNLAAQLSRASATSAYTAGERSLKGVSREFTGEITGNQAMQIESLDAFGRAIGRKIRIVDTITYRNETGEEVSSAGNAYYKDGVYTIALDGVGQAYMYFAMHENIHDISQNNRIGYENLERVVFETLEAKGQNIDDLLAVQKELYPDKDEAYWREEIVANTVPVILTDKQTAVEFAERIASEDKAAQSVFVKILNAIKNLLTKAYNILSGQKSWEQMKLIHGDLKAIAAIREAYLSALEEVGHQFPTAKPAKASWEVTSGKAIAYSLKDHPAIKYDDRGAVAVVNPDSITMQEWAKIDIGMRRLGYDWRGAEDTKDIISRMNGRFLNEEQSNVIKRVLQLSESTDGLIDPKKVRDIAQKAEATFGRTSYIKKAGYLTVNGALLDFSEGQATRTMDHREIAEILDLSDDAGYSDGMIEFMKMGNIRLMPETPGINISVLPNSAQKTGLRRWFEYFRGEVSVDFDAPNGNTVASIDYPRGTRTERILSDIDRYFKEDIIPEISNVSRFHEVFSLKDDYRRTEKENENLKKKLAALNEEFKTTEGSRRNDTKKVSELSRRIIREYGSKYDTKSLAKSLDDIYSVIRNSEELTWEDVASATDALSRDILKEATVTVTPEDRDNWREYLRKTGVTIPEINKTDVANALRYDNLMQARRALYGTLNLSLSKKQPAGQMFEQGETQEAVRNFYGLDQLYKELQGRYGWPDTFDVAEQIIAIRDFALSLKPYSTNPYYFETEYAGRADKRWMNEEVFEDNVRRLSIRLLDEYFDIPDSRTFADKAEEAVIGERKKGYARLEREREKGAIREQQLKDKIAELKGDLDTPGKIAKLEAGNANLVKVIDALKEELRVTKGHRVTDASLRTLAGSILTYAKSKYSVSSFVKSMRRLADYLANTDSPVWEDVSGYGVALARDILLKSSNMDTTLYDKYQDLFSELKKKTVSLNAAQKEAVMSVYESNTGYADTLLGVVKFSEEGTPLTAVWSALSERYPELFPANVTEADIPQMFQEAIESIMPQYTNQMNQSIDAAAYDLFLQIYEDYFKLPEFKTLGDKLSAARLNFRDAKTKARLEWTRQYKERLIQMNEEYLEQRKALVTQYNAARVTGDTALIKKLQTQYARLNDPATRKLIRQKAKFETWKKTDKARRAESATKSKLRARIEKTVQTLYSWMLNPTEKAHVPEAMRNTVGEFLESIDMAGNKETQKANLWHRKLAKLQKDLAATQGEDSVYPHMDIDIDIVTRLSEFIDQSEDVVNFADLDATQLRELDYLVATVKYAITEANKLHAIAAYQDIAELGDKTMADLSKKAAKIKHMKPIAMVDDLLNFGQLDSFSFFEQLGDGGNAVLRALRDGLDKKISNVAAAERYMDRVFKELGFDKKTPKFDKVHKFKVEGGELVLTDAQIMELYLLNKREQARGHIYEGGIRQLAPRVRVPDMKRLQSYTPARVNYEDVSNIISTLSEEQKKLADAIQKFAGTDCAEWGNETSLILFNMRKFTEESYWPIKSDDNFIFTKEPSNQAGPYALQNMGATKATIQGANNPIVLGDVFDTFIRHVDQMSSYNAFVVPISDAMKWFNYKEYGAGSVKQSIERAYGKNGKEYFLNFILDLNGAAYEPYSPGISEWLIKNFKTASVGANLSVIIQQGTSYLRAANVIDPKYLAKAVFEKKNLELAKIYAPITQWKSWGFYDVNLGKSLRDIILGDQTVIEKVREKTLTLAQKMDEVTWATLWAACELEIQDIRKDLELGTADFYEAVGKRLSDVIDRTQVVDSVFHRSQIMRSKNTLVQLSTSFMSEPTKSYNMLRTAFVNFAQNKNKGAGKKVVRAIAAFSSAAVLNAAVTSIVGALRNAKTDDDEDGIVDSFLRRWESSFRGDVAEGLNPLMLIPYVKDLVSIIDGYDSNRIDMEALEKAVGAIGYLIKGIEGEEISTTKLVYSLAQAVSYSTGVPVSSAMRDLTALYNTVAGDDINLSGKEPSKQDGYKKIYTALVGGDVEYAKKLRQKMIASGNATALQVDTGLANLLKDYDERIKEAYEYREAVNISALKRVRNELISEGYSSEVVDKAINLYKASLSAKSSATADKDLQADLYSYDDLYKAIDKKGTTDVKEIYKELLSDSTAKDPESAIRSRVITEFKDDYVETVDKGDTKEIMDLAEKLLLFGVEQKDLDGWVMSDQSEKMKDALGAGSASEVNEYIREQVQLGRADTSIKQTVTSEVKPIILDMYDRGDTAGMARMITMLEGLELYTKKGTPYYTIEFIEDWVIDHISGK